MILRLFHGERVEAVSRESQVPAHDIESWRKDFAFVSTTCDPSPFPLGSSTPSVQLEACASSPIYLSVGVLLSGSGNSVPGKTKCVRFPRRTPTSLQADQNPDRAVVDHGRHAPMMLMRWLLLGERRLTLL